MKTGHMLKLVVVSVTMVVVCATIAQAGLRLSLDARAPGSSPSTEWADLSGNNQPFTAVGIPTLTTTGVGDVYRFNEDRTGDSFIGDVADESNFDFDVASGTGADPFTVVMYAGSSSSGANKGDPTIRKHLGVFGNPSFETKGWHVNYVTDFAGRFPVVRQIGDASNWMGVDFGDAIASGDNDMHLLVFHIPGDGL
jgi:hypothetical protein